jgi:hypothetical protein
MVEPQPSKLMVRVRFPLPAPRFYQRGSQGARRRSQPEVSGLCSYKAHIAQSVEHFLGKEEVTGSIPVMSSSFFGDVFRSV